MDRTLEAALERTKRPAEDGRPKPNSSQQAEQFDVAAPTILRDLFKTEHIRRTIKRMRSWHESENEVTHPLRQLILDLYGANTASVESRIEIARFLGDARIVGQTTDLVNRVVGEVMAEDIRLGSGYARALMLLCLNKYGSREHRDKVRERLSLDKLQDDQLRLHYLYVYYCRNELDETIARAARHMDTPDVSLLMRLCHDAKDGKLATHLKCLRTCATQKNGCRTILARHLPLVHRLLRADHRRAENLKWLEEVTSQRHLEQIKDGAIRRFLEEERVFALR